MIDLVMQFLIQPSILQMMWCKLLCKGQFEGNYFGWTPFNWTDDVDLKLFIYLEKMTLHINYAKKKLGTKTKEIIKKKQIIKF